MAVHPIFIKICESTKVEVFDKDSEMELKLSVANSFTCTFAPCTTLHFSLSAVKRTQKISC